MMKGLRSIRFRLITLYVLIVALVCLSFSGYVFWAFRNYMIDYLHHNLARRAHQIGLSLVDNVEKTGLAYIGTEIEARYAPELNERFISICKLDGTDIYTSHNSLSFSRKLIGRLIMEMQTKLESDQQIKIEGGHELYFVTQRYSLPTGENYLVIVGAPETDVRSALEGLVATLAWGLPIMVGLSILAGYILVGRSLRPIDRVVLSAEAITLQNLSNRLPVPQTGDEFERLSLALNRMIERLDEAFQLNNRFTEDASHELRTPLTVMRGELEILLREDLRPEDYRETLGSILEETERLTHIVEGLLMVSRLETGEAQLHKQVVNLGDLVKNTADQMSLLSEDKHQELSCTIVGTVLTEVDPARFKQVVVNLIDNAVKYTPEGGKIKLSVYSDLAKENPKDHQVVFEIADTGVGISNRDLSHVFERFFRTDPARNSRSGGTGLGLSIVQSIVQAHGGLVHVQSKEGEGTRFRVELPVFADEQMGAIA